jgi:DNA gyrase subunit A
VIYGYEGVKDAFETGRGRIVLRGEATIESDEHGRDVIIVTSIPYQVNKAEMIKKTTELVNDKKIEGITEIRDESDRHGVRIVYEIRKDAITNVVLNKLYQYTQLQNSFNVNNIALVKGRPQTLNLKDIIRHFVEHRHVVVVRRTKFELAEAEKKAHILEGLMIALDNLDAVITLIRASKTPDEARTGLMTNFNLSEIQAKAILDLRLQRLTGLERDKIKADYEELLKLIAELKNILGDESLRMKIIKDELLEIKEKYGDEPRTQIVYNASDFRIEDTIADENVVITISHMGYIKRTPLSEYRVQNRGGKGMKGSDVRDEDFLEHLFVATNHNYLLFFTENGKCFWLRAFEIPEGTKASKGRAIQNLISIPPDDKVRAYINVKDLKDQEYIENNFIILATQKGTIKKTSLDAYSRPRQNGINAITIHEGDHLLEAKLTNGEDEVVLALKSGRAIRFNEKTVRPMGRNAAGVRGIRRSVDSDEVIGMICIPKEKKCEVLVVSENGYGKRSDIEDYRVTNRGGKGVKTLNITDKTGALIAIKDVTDSDDLMIINRSGIIIRMAVVDLRIMGRATQGVRLIKINEGDAIAAVTKVDVEEEGKDLEEGIDETTGTTGSEDEGTGIPATEEEN